MAKKKTNRKVELEHYQTHDPGKGSFVPNEKPPVRDRETNPRGVRHLGKTAQDYMPRDQRPRVHEAQRRAEKMRGTAS